MFKRFFAKKCARIEIEALAFASVSEAEAKQISAKWAERVQTMSLSEILDEVTPHALAHKQSRKLFSTSIGSEFRAIAEKVKAQEKAKKEQEKAQKNAPPAQVAQAAA